VDDVILSPNGPVARHVYYSAAIEHGKHNGGDSTKFCSTIKTSEYSSLVDHWRAKSALYDYLVYTAPTTITLLHT